MFPLSSKPLCVIAAKSFSLHNLAITPHIHLDDSQKLAKASHLMSSRGNGWKERKGKRQKLLFSYDAFKTG